MVRRTVFPSDSLSHDASAPFTIPASKSPSNNKQADEPSNQAFLLALLTAGGGLTGYIRSGSVPSVAAGMTIGALYGFGGYRIRNRQPYGVEMALLASIVLAGSSVPRAFRTMKPLPIGLSLLAAFGLYRFGTVWNAQAR